MEQVNSPGVSGIPLWLVRSFAVVVTADVCMVIASSWRAYDVLGKSLAAVLLAYLAVIPAVATWRRKRTSGIEWSNLIPAYVLLMLATMLFGMRMR